MPPAVTEAAGEHSTVCLAVCSAISRQAVTAASISAGLNGFCRLRTAPSLVAMFRKSGPDLESDGMRRPDITMIGISGRRWRTHRIVSSPSMPGMKISRNSKSNASASKIARPLRPSPAVTTLCPARSKQQPDCHLNRRFVVHDQNSCHRRSSVTQCRVVNRLRRVCKCFFASVSSQVFLLRQGAGTRMCTMRGIADHAGVEQRLWTDITGGRLRSMDSGSVRRTILMRGGRSACS
jgi:hypothetical protein